MGIITSPGAATYAPGDASLPRFPGGLFLAPSSYVTNAEQAAQSQQSFSMAVAAGVAIAVIWFLGRKK